MHPLKLFLFALLGFCFSLPAHSQTDPGARWVLAPSGLNLRASSNPSSQKLTKLEFGEQLEVIWEGNGPALTVDQIEAPMVKVRYGHQTGFVFAGYLSQFPPPEKKAQELSKTLTYVYELQEKGFEIAYESHFYEHGGPISEEEVFYLPAASWPEAFLIAKTLYELPKHVLFPKPSQSETERFSHPTSPGYFDFEHLLVKRGKNGELVSLSYVRSGEGHYSVTVELDEENRRMKIICTMATC